MAERKRAKTSGTPASIREALKKATTEMLVLFVLRQKKMYTYEMMQEISHMSDGKIAFNTLYQAIYRLQSFQYIKEDGKVVSDDNRIRIYFTITPSGEEYLDKLMEEYHSFTGAWITSCPRPTSCAASNSLFCPRAPCQIHQKKAVATSNCNSLFLSPDAFRSVVDFLTFYDIIILQFGSPSF